MDIPVRVLSSSVSRIRKLVCTSHVRSDVFGEPFPYEDRDEDGPEEDTTLPLGEDPLTAVHGVEQLHLRHEERIHRPCRIDQIVTCEANETVANELGRDEPVSRDKRRAVGMLV